MTVPESKTIAAPGCGIEESFRLLGISSVPFNFQIGGWRFLTLARPLVILKWIAGSSASGLAPESLPAVSGADGYLLKGIPAPIDPALVGPRAGWTCMKLTEYPRHLIDLTTSFEAYLTKFSGKTRSTIRRKLRKFEELSQGAVAWKEFRSPSEIDEFFPLAREVSAKTYQEQLLNAGLPNSEAFKEETRERASQGLVRAYILFLERRPISYLYLPVEDGRAVYAYLGYDPAYAEHSPGTVLQMLALERMFADPSLEVFDFTEGAGQHKQLFATHTENCADLLFLTPRSKAVMIARAHQAFICFETWLGRQLDRLGIKRNLKMLMRRLAARKD